MHPNYLLRHMFLLCARGQPRRTEQSESLQVSCQGSPVSARAALAEASPG